MDLGSASESDSCAVVSAVTGRSGRDGIYSGRRFIFQQDLPDNSELSNDREGNDSISVVPDVPPFHIRCIDDPLQALDGGAQSKESAGLKREISPLPGDDTGEERRRPEPGDMPPAVRQRRADGAFWGPRAKPVVRQYSIRS